MHVSVVWRWLISVSAAMNVPESLSTTGLKPTWAELIDQITWCSLTEICHNLESNQSLRILTNSLMKCVHNGCRTKWFRFPCLIPPSRFIFTTMLTVQQTQRCKMWAEGHSSARSSCAIIPAPSHLFSHKNSQNARSIRSGHSSKLSRSIERATTSLRADWLQRRARWTCLTQKQSDHTH